MNTKPTSRHPGGTPPLHARFQKGVSGNPNGRPKGSVNFMTQLAAELKSTIKVHEAGKTKTISKQKALIKQFVGKALKGDDKAFGKLIPLILSIGSEELTEMGQALTSEQKVILERNALRLLGALTSKDADQ
jgi:Family of unknown function (DUF5681)